MEILKNYDLTKLNTFGVSARTKYLVELNNEHDLGELLKSPEFKDSEKLFLGGGSNILFTKDFDGVVVLDRLKGIEIVEENSEIVFVRSMGGEAWHDLVLFAVDRELWGIENLSLIPGTVGAAPMQNIGAYGVELKDVLENVEAYEIETGKKKVFKREECEFDYRSSIFKTKLKGKYFITSVTLKLSKLEKKNIEYKILQDYLEKNRIEVKNSKDISDAVVTIRKSKLPDPVLIGNAGSFFKNVFVTKEKVESLLSTYPDMPYFKEELPSQEEEIIKIPAGWLIERSGWKGRHIGNVGVHENQALVLVNYGGATGEEIKDLSLKIIDSVNSKFGLVLEREVNLV